GGIVANNTYRAEFLYDNIMIEANIIHAAHQISIEKLLFLGSSCIYPKDAPQPLKEEYLLTDILEPTNEPYAIAKIAGLKLCENYYRQYGDNFFSVMPTNLYGPHDNFNLQTSHVLPALIRKFHEAKCENLPTVTVWGTGKVYREFLYVQDMANACIKLLIAINAEDIYKHGISHINIGTGKDLIISDLVNLIAEIVQYSGQIVYDESKPDGVHKKLLDISRLREFGWREKISLKEGIDKTYKWFLKNHK
ncbi:MAG: GDP-L-fucose synthase, partial [Candidatus Neomarinimicrobiota bacterium]